MYSLTWGFIKDNAPKAVGSCSTFNDFSKQQNGDDRAHTPYFIVAYVVRDFGQQIDDPPI